jgi:diacylglycerol kinase
MKKLKGFVRKVLRVWWMTALAVVLFAGCKTQYVPVETVRTEIERVVDVQRDSIYVMDSVFVREKADTVFVTRWRTEYKEALRVDTFRVERIDTLNTIVEVEKKLTKVQQLKMDVGAGVLYAVPILIAIGLYILYRKLKK